MTSLQSTQISDLFQEIPSPWGEMVTISVENIEMGTPAGTADFVILVTWDGVSCRFVAESQVRGTPRVLQLAATQAEEYAAATGLSPMVVVPFLADRQLRMLIESGISGLDLCGNGVIIAPGKMLLCRTGQPNQYPESQPVRFAYRGSTSIVPRVFLVRPEFRSVKEIRDEVRKRGVVIAPSTVSKALARMEEDVLIRRVGDRIVLVQPDELLDRLASSFHTPRMLRKVEIRTDLPLAEVFRHCPQDLRLVLTGASSMTEYAVGARGDVTTVYCKSIPKLRYALGEHWNETSRFADLTVIETRAKEVYFDTRRNDDGVVCASALQTFIELYAGDKRDKQMADQIRNRILANIRYREELS